MSTSIYSRVLACVCILGLIHLSSASLNCSANTDGRSLSCYSCMGRDLENCMTGKTCCQGSCYKLIDKVHDVVVKGCMIADEEDASMKVRELDITLYWAKNEKVKGEAFFCNGEGNHFCNPAPAVSLMSVISSMAVLGFLRILA